MSISTGFAVEAPEAQLLEYKQLQHVCNDLEFAYKMQLQEAVRVSLGQEPVAAVVDLTSDAVDLTMDEDYYDATAIEVHELDAAVWQMRDAMVAQKLAKEDERKAAQAMHDMQFASFIQNLPEAAWDRTDANLEDPFHESSACVLCVTLRFDGNSRGNPGPAGCGAVLLDPTGAVLWRGKQSLGVVSASVAEMRGLLLGLKRAVELGLSRVHVEGNSIEVVNQALGRVRVTDPKLRSMLADLQHLQKDLADFSIKLIPQEDNSEAHGLARAASMKPPPPDEAEEAAAAKRARAGQASSSGLHGQVDCAICLEAVPAAYCSSLGGCGHQFCNACLSGHLSCKLKERAWPITCPHPRCAAPAQVEDCWELLEQEEMQGFNKLLAEASIPEEQRFYCPYQTCSELMVLEEMGPDNPTLCPSCHKTVCPWCRTKWHSGLSCGQYQALPPDQRDPEDGALLLLASRRKWRQCQRCKMMVERALGCNHIVCLCGHEFCYSCGAPMPGKRLTCRCELWDADGRQLLAEPQEDVVMEPLAVEARAARRRYHKTRLCRYYARGHCRFGDNCDFAHGEEELQFGD